MRRIRRTLFPLFIFFLFSAITTIATLAQSSSTDVLPRGSFYVEVDFNTHPMRFRDGGYQTYASHLVFGVSRNLEAGVNLEFSNPITPDQGVELQPNIKWQFHNNESKGTAASIGGVLYLPVGRRAGTDTFGMLYGNFSKQLKGRFGPRFTAGAYLLPKFAKEAGARAGMTLNYEQPLTSKISFGIDWVGGNNRFGYVTPGVTFAVSRRSQLYVGFNMGNEGRGNNELGISYGIQF